MANAWFRMYSEFSTDPKVQSMSEAMQRRLVMFFCMQSCDVTVTLSDEDIAFQLRISDIELSETKLLFLKKGFIDEFWNVKNWDKRQFASDSSAERTALYRARKKAEKEAAELLNPVTVTSRERRSDVLDTDTDTDKKQKKGKPTVPASAETAEVFEYWKQVMNHPAAQLDAKRSKNISARLKDGYTVSQLCRAVDGCKYDPFSQGANDRQTVYDDIELICRDGPKVDKFMAIADRGPQQTGRTVNQQKTLTNLERYLQENPS